MCVLLPINTAAGMSADYAFPCAAPHADPDHRRPDLAVTWVDKTSSRIWRGSYANQHWQVGLHLQAAKAWQASSCIKRSSTCRLHVQAAHAGTLCMASITRALDHHTHTHTQTQTHTHTHTHTHTTKQVNIPRDISAVHAVSCVLSRCTSSPAVEECPAALYKSEPLYCRTCTAAVLQFLGRGAWKPREAPKRGQRRHAKASAGGATGSGRRGGGSRAVRSDGGNSQQHKRGRGRQGE
jgi:hypothetical protein